MLKHSDGPEKDHSDYLLIKDVSKKGKKELGFRGVKMNLKRDKQIAMNHKKVLRIMKKYYLFCNIRKRNPYKSKSSG